MSPTHFHFGGIIPYYRKDGSYHVLLGREVSDGTWSPFGGSINHGETLVDGIVREAYEETMGFLGDIPHLRQTISRAKVGLVYRDQQPGGQPDHWSFQILVGVSPELVKTVPRNFNQTYQYIKGCNASVVNHNGCCEKSEVRWFPLSQVVLASKTSYFIGGDPNDPIRSIFNLTMSEGDLVKLPVDNLGEFAESLVLMSEGRDN
jgi:ADP-ribose pyrophosphatase YjhB (NUDIX family)